MTKTFYLILLALPFLQCKSVTAQKSPLTISYTNSEKSRDSHSTTEFISIDDKAVSYSVSYSGRKGPNQKDEEKKCTFTTDQVNKISKLMNERQLNVPDSLFDNSSTDGSYTNTASITIILSKGAGKIKVRGYTKTLGDKPLYKNALYLIAFIRNMVEDCTGK